MKTKLLSKNFNGLKFLLILSILMLGVGTAWAGGSSYYTGFKATGGATGKGYVYASTSNTATPVYETEVTAESKSDDLGENGTKKYYAWAKAVRGSDFNGWSISGDNGTVTPASGTDSPITVTVTSAKDATNTGTATANWTSYTKVNVTYNPSADGIYSVTYQYNSYNTTTKEITTGDAENLSRTISSENGAQTIGTYKNDVITLKSTSGTFQGWYSDAGFNSLLSTANPYTYTAPTSGSAAVYPKYEHVDKYYGRLTASIAEVPYSMPGGGTIFVSKEEAGTGTYSADAQTVDNIGMGTTGLKYYLHAQPTDKRYVFRGWYSNPECTGTALSTSADYTYTFTATSMNSASPTTGNVYAAFDFNLYYMQVEAEPAVPGLGMVLVKDNNTGTPEYNNYTTHSEQFLYAYRLAPTANAYLYAKPKYGYKFSGWYDNPDCTGTAKSTANPYTYAATGSSTDPMNPTIAKLYAKFVEDASTVNITYNRPDQTKGEYTASVLDIAEVDDDFIWTFTQVFTSEGKTGNTTQAQHKTDVLRLEAQSKAGYGVTSWTIAGAAKTTPSQLYETTGTAAATYGVTFGDAKPFLVCATTSATTGTAYASLAEALANLGTNKKIVVVQNAYVPAGNYTIPNGVTLLVPFDEAQTLYTTKPGITTAAPSGQSAYCTLTLGNGANVKVNGAISVSAHQNKGQPYGGAVTGKYGKIELKEGANITLNNGSYLYCWGYITGAGSVDALSGSTVYEDFQITCWRGGSCASDMVGNDQKVFPLAQYAIQNVEARINFHYGSSETVYTGVTVKYFDPETSAKIIGTTDGLFQLSSGAVLSRWYNASVDRQMYELNGNASIGYVLINMYANIDSRNYVLPITNNMDITVKTGTLSCDNDFALLPGASITIDEGAKASLGSNSRLYVYDKAEWPEKTTGYNYPSNVAFCKVAYTDTKITTARTYANMADAKLDVNGTLEISKAIYTTAGGANICSSEGTGLIVLKAAAGTDNITYQAIQESNYVKEYVAIPITAAKLHNGDDSYTLTAGAVANDQFIYSKSQEKWLKNPKVVSWNANGGTTDASTMAYSQGSFVGELPAAYKDGHTLEGWYTAADGGTKIDATTKVTANTTYYAHWTPKSYTITYRDLQGVAFTGAHVDSPTAHPVTHTFGTATALNKATKDGYEFGGWYRTPSCGGTAVTSIAASECKDITLYALWKVVSVTAGGKTTYFATVAEAVTFANTKTNAVVTMLQNASVTSEVTISAAMTIDLNGKTISSALASATGVFKINASGMTVTITDSGTSGKIDHTASYSGGYMYGIYVTAGSLSVECGTVYAKNTAANRAYGIYTDGSASSITVSGTGTVQAESSTSPFGIYSSKEGCTLTMDGGTFIANGSGSRGIYMKGETNLTNATITASGSGAYAIFAVSGDMTINSGTYTATGASNNLCIYHRKNVITIYGGYFNTTNKLYTKDTGSSDYNGTITLQGGYYNKDTELAGKCASGYHVLPNADATYIYKVAEAYTITFKNGDNVLQSGLVEKGQTPSYTGETPTKTATAQYTYTFNNTWSPALAPVESAQTYTAQFNSTVNKYHITWQVKLNGETLESKEEDVEYGQTPSYGKDPSKAPTDREVFTFSGWTPEVASVTGDQEYIGSFNGSPRPYTITFVNDDGTELWHSDFGYGSTPSYGGTPVTPVSTQNSTYTFAGWSPEITDVAGEATYTATYRIANIEVKADESKDVTVSASTNVTTVYVSGSLSVAEGKTLKTTTLVLEASPDGSGQISGNIDAEKAYLEYNLGGSQSGIWYDIAVPWEVDATNGVYLDGVEKQLNKDFYLIYYNGALRASQNRHTDECWQFVGRESTPDNHMHPGRLYMIYLPKAGVKKLRFKRDGDGRIETPEIQVYEYNYEASIVNRGWNGIANPTIYKAYLNAGAYTIEVGSTTVQTANYGQKYNPVYNNYDAFNMDETKLNVSQPVFVQVGTSRSVVVNASEFPSLAPVRKALVNNAAYEVQISAGANYTDRIYLQTVEGKEDSYRIGLDLSKAGTSSKVAQMWVNRYDTKLCVNTTAPVGTTANYPLGISVPSDGTYEITSATEMQEGQEIYVTYNGRAIWNLAYGPYAVTLNKGTYNEYGLKLVQKAPTITTGVETVSDERLEGSGVRKVLIDDHIYIIREGAVYTINGKQVK